MQEKFNNFTTQQQGWLIHRVCQGSLGKKHACVGMLIFKTKILNNFTTSWKSNDCPFLKIYIIAFGDYNPDTTKL